MWWPFRRKPKPLPIPKFRPPAEEPKVEPAPEPIEVHELLDPSQTVIDRFKDLLKRKLKG